MVIVDAGMMSAKNIKLLRDEGYKYIIGARIKSESGYMMEIIDKTITYDHFWEEGLVDNLQGIFHSPSEIHNFIFGKYLTMDEFGKRPFSRLPHDLLEQLGLIINNNNKA